MLSKRWWVIKPESKKWEWINLLYLPYTLMFIAFGGIGTMFATTINYELLPVGAIVLFIGVGINAHCLDELKGRPLGTSIPSWQLWFVAILSSIFGAFIALYYIITFHWFILILFGASLFLVWAYNYELFKGWFHNDMIFIFGFGLIPQILGYFMMTKELPPFSILLIFGAIASVCGIETTVNHFIKWNSQYQLEYDSKFNYLTRSVWIVVFLPIVLFAGLFLWRIGY